MTGVSTPLQAGYWVRGQPPSALRVRRIALRTVDSVAAAAAAGFSVAIVPGALWTMSLVAAGLWMVGIVLSGAHSSASLRMRRQASTTLIAAVGITFAGLVGSLLVGVPPIFLALWPATILLCGLAGRLVLFAHIGRSPVGLAFLMEEERLGELWPQLGSLLGEGYEVRAIVEPRGQALAERVASVLEVRRIDEVIMALDDNASADAERVLSLCRERKTTALTLDELYEDLTGQCLNYASREIVPLPRSPFHPVGSRLLDVCVGFLFLLACLPLLALSAVTPGPTIEVDQYEGRRGQRLRLAMLPRAGTHAPVLRRLLASLPTRLVPLAPALISGKLSVIGPELTKCGVSAAENELPMSFGARARDLRASVRPGITGWAEINGAATGQARLAFDLYYIRHRSLGFDLSILLRALASPLLSWRAASGETSMKEGEELVIPAELTIVESQELLSVIVPAFRESGRIEKSLRLLLTELKSLAVPFEVIVVSDGNTDGTESEAARVGGPVTLIHYPRNRGKGFALRRGLLESRGSRVVFIDADMDLHPSGIRRLLSLLDAGADVAIGSKRHPESKVTYPWPRRVQSLVFQWMVRRMFGLNVTDTQTGLKAFNGPIVRTVGLGLTTDGFAFDLELLIELTRRGALVAEGPVELDYAFRSTTGLAAVRDTVRETLRLWHRRRTMLPPPFGEVARA